MYNDSARLNSPSLGADVAAERPAPHLAPTRKPRRRWAARLLQCVVAGGVMGVGFTAGAAGVVWYATQYNWRPGDVAEVSAPVPSTSQQTAATLTDLMPRLVNSATAREQPGAQVPTVRSVEEAFTVAEPAAAPRDDGVSVDDQATRIATLMERAVRQTRELKLTTPAGDNARESYEQVLALAPEHQPAHDGLLHLGIRYVDLAHKVSKRGDLALAESFADKARELAPKDPRVQAMTRALAERRQAAAALAAPAPAPTTAAAPMPTAALTTADATPATGAGPIRLVPRQ
ncbi:MAG: hypothetical protein RIM84_23515 [Alphaproteobacteria bacterium]